MPITLSSGSTCDICTEPFDGTSPLKAPCSIQCGHIFCYECLNRIEPSPSDPSTPACPLCRQPYGKHYIIKLHLDTDNAQRGASTPSPANPAEQEARRLQQKMTTLINNGASEPTIRGLLDECQKFVHSQPRNLFPELRMSHRVMAYLVDVRSELVSQKQVSADLKGQIEQLEEEKAELERRVKDMKVKRRAFRKCAEEREGVLRDHCERAHTAYETIVNQYNFVVQEWMRLQQQTHYFPSASQPMPPTPPDLDSDSELTKTPQPRTFIHFDQSKLKEAAIQDPDTPWIAPLPQFTGSLPTRALISDDDELHDVIHNPPITMVVHEEEPDSAFQPFAIPPSPSPLAAKRRGSVDHSNGVGEDFTKFKDTGLDRASSCRSVERPFQTPVVELQMKVPPHATPMMSPGRARSHSIPPQNSDMQSRHSSPRPPRSDDVSTTIGSPSKPIGIHGRGSDSLRRLHDLLEDDDVATSSSLPNMSSHLSTPFNREVPHHADIPSSRVSSHPTTSSTPSQQHRMKSLLSPRQGDVERGKSLPPSDTNHVAPSTPSISLSRTPTQHESPPQTQRSSQPPTFSSASDAAKALEKERKEKQRERRRLEKSSQETADRPVTFSSASASSTRSHTSSSAWESSSPHTPSHVSNRYTTTSASIPVPRMQLAAEPV